jgi:Sugar (and other) transporter
MASFDCHSVHPRFILHRRFAFRPRYVSSSQLFSQPENQLNLPSPRWLLEKNRPEDAHKALIYLRGAEDSPQDIEPELQEIKANVEFHNSITEASWFTLFTDSDLRARLWRGALLQFMAQMCGATAIKYYLPTVFLALGLSKDLSLMASGIESTLKIGCTIIEMLIIDKLGRKKTLLLGTAIMSLSMIVSLTKSFKQPHCNPSPE